MRLVLALVLCVGCYAPQPQPGAPCPTGVCPTDLVCSPATQTCELTAIDAAVVDLATPLDTAQPDTPPNVPSLLQQNTNYAATADSLSVTLPLTPTPGHVVVMIGATPSGSLTSVSGGGTWTLATRSTTNANIELWYTIADGSSATVTIARATNASPMWLAVSEWSGLATTNVLVDAASTFGTMTPATAGSITTLEPALILFAASNGSPNTFGSPTPGTWTLMTGVIGANVQSEWYQVATAAGTFTPAVSQTANIWEAAIAAFRYSP